MNYNPNKVFLNRSFDKKRLKALLLWFRLNLSEGAALKAVEILQGLGFRSATQGAISLGLDDLKTPASKGGRVFQAQLEVSLAYHEHHRGNRTPVELFQHLVDTWHRTSQDLTSEVIKLFHSTERVNPVYMMAFSGARGNISQVRQLVGMRGLMADPRGQIVGFPILSNFREGLTITEYFVSCYGARKGVVDTAIRTADAGYLTRRLADVSHHVVVRTTNCGTHRSINLRDIKEGEKTILSLANRLVGRVLAERISKPSGEFAQRNEEITPDLASKLASQHFQVPVRSPLSCSLRWGVCQLCYGWGLSEGRRVTLGEAVGIIAAQSIGEPGTQLTLRTFHTGGVFSGDLLNEIRAPYDGIIKFSQPLQGLLVRTAHGQIAFLTKVAGKMVISPTIDDLPCFLDSEEVSSFIGSASQARRGTGAKGSESLDPLPPFGLAKQPLRGNGNSVDTRDLVEFVLQPSTMVFVREKEQVLQNQLLAEFSSSNLQSTNDQIEITQQVLSETAGQVWFKEIYYGSRKGPGSGSLGTHFSSEKLGGIWVLAGKPTSPLMLTDRRPFPLRRSTLSGIRGIEDAPLVAKHKPGAIEVLTPSAASLDSLQLCKPEGVRLTQRGKNFEMYPVVPKGHLLYLAQLEGHGLAKQMGYLHSGLVGVTQDVVRGITNNVQSAEIPNFRGTMGALALPKDNLFGCYKKFLTPSCLEKSGGKHKKLQVYKTSVINLQYDHNFFKYHYSIGYSQLIDCTNFIAGFSLTAHLFPLFESQRDNVAMAYKNCQLWEKSFLDLNSAKYIIASPLKQPKIQKTKSHIHRATYGCSSSGLRFAKEFWVQSKQSKIGKFLPFWTCGAKKLGAQETRDRADLLLGTQMVKKITEKIRIGEPRMVSPFTFYPTGIQQVKSLNSSMAHTAGLQNSQRNYLIERGFVDIKANSKSFYSRLAKGWLKKPKFTSTFLDYVLIPPLPLDPVGGKKHEPRDVDKSDQKFMGSVAWWLPKEWKTLSGVLFENSFFANKKKFKGQIFLLPTCFVTKKEILLYSQDQSDFAGAGSQLQGSTGTLPFHLEEPKFKGTKQVQGTTKLPIQAKQDLETWLATSNTFNIFWNNTNENFEIKIGEQALTPYFPEHKSSKPYQVKGKRILQDSVPTTLIKLGVAEPPFVSTKLKNKAFDTSKAFRQVDDSSSLLKKIKQNAIKYCSVQINFGVEKSTKVEQNLKIIEPFKAKLNKNFFVPTCNKVIQYPLQLFFANYKSQNTLVITKLMRALDLNLRKFSAVNRRIFSPLQESYTFESFATLMYKKLYLDNFSQKPAPRCFFPLTSALQAQSSASANFLYPVIVRRYNPTKYNQIVSKTFPNSPLDLLENKRVALPRRGTSFASSKRYKTGLYFSNNVLSMVHILEKVDAKIDLTPKGYQLRKPEGAAYYPKKVALEAQKLIEIKAIDINNQTRISLKRKERIKKLLSINPFWQTLSLTNYPNQIQTIFDVPNPSLTMHILRSKYPKGVRKSNKAGLGPAKHKEIKSFTYKFPKHENKKGENKNVFVPQPVWLSVHISNDYNAISQKVNRPLGVEKTENNTVNFSSVSGQFFSINKNWQMRSLLKSNRKKKQVERNDGSLDQHIVHTIHLPIVPFLYIIHDPEGIKSCESFHPVTTAPRLALYPNISTLFVLPRKTALQEKEANTPKGLKDKTYANTPMTFSGLEVQEGEKKLQVDKSRKKRTEVKGTLWLRSTNNKEKEKITNVGGTRQGAKVRPLLNIKTCYHSHCGAPVQGNLLPLIRQNLWQESCFNRNKTMFGTTAEINRLVSFQISDIINAIKKPPTKVIAPKEEYKVFQRSKVGHSLNHLNSNALVWALNNQTEEDLHESTPEGFLPHNLERAASQKKKAASVHLFGLIDIKYPEGLLRKIKKQQSATKIALVDVHFKMILPLRTIINPESRYTSAHLKLPINNTVAFISTPVNPKTLVEIPETPKGLGCDQRLHGTTEKLYPFGVRGNKPRQSSGHNQRLLFTPEGYKGTEKFSFAPKKVQPLISKADLGLSLINENQTKHVPQRACEADQVVQMSWTELSGAKQHLKDFGNKASSPLQETPHTNCFSLMQQISEYSLEHSNLNRQFAAKRKKLKYSPFLLDLPNTLIGETLSTYPTKEPNYVCYPKKAIFGLGKHGEKKGQDENQQATLTKKDSLFLSNTALAGNKQFTHLNHPIYLHWYASFDNSAINVPSDYSSSFLTTHLLQSIYPLGVRKNKKDQASQDFFSYSSSSSYCEGVSSSLDASFDSSTLLYPEGVPAFLERIQLGKLGKPGKGRLDKGQAKRTKVFTGNTVKPKEVNIRTLLPNDTHVNNKFSKNTTNLPKPILYESDQVTFIADQQSGRVILTNVQNDFVAPPAFFDSLHSASPKGVTLDALQSVGDQGSTMLKKTIWQFYFNKESIPSTDQIKFSGQDLKLTKQNPVSQGGISFESPKELRLVDLSLAQCFAPKGHSNGHQKLQSIKNTFNLFPGQLIAYGDSIAKNTATTESGQVLYVDSQKTILRKAQTVLIYSQAIIAVSSGEWIRKGTPLMALSYQKLVTGDIVQGLPKIEQFFEAPVLKDGTFWSDSLQAKLNQFFQEHREELPLAEAVRKGFSEIQRVLVEGVQQVYISQGVLIADKHLEVIVRQMTCKGRILYSGDTGFLRNELVSLDKIESVNQVTYGQKALYHPQVRGITDASLESESFLSAASFQETTRVLSRDAIIGKTDLMRGLKERVIVGELIQAGTGLVNNNVYNLL